MALADQRSQTSLNERALPFGNAFHVDALDKPVDHHEAKRSPILELLRRHRDANQHIAARCVGLFDCVGGREDLATVTRLPLSFAVTASVSASSSGKPPSTVTFEMATERFEAFWGGVSPAGLVTVIAPAGPAGGANVLGVTRDGATACPFARPVAIERATAATAIAGPFFGGRRRALPFPRPKLPSCRCCRDYKSSTGKERQLLCGELRREFSRRVSKYRCCNMEVTPLTG